MQKKRSIDTTLRRLFNVEYIVNLLLKSGYVIEHLFICLCLKLSYKGDHNVFR
jgi:hypothetical protein